MSASAEGTLTPMADAPNQPQDEGDSKQEGHIVLHQNRQDNGVKANQEGRDPLGLEFFVMLDSAVHSWLQGKPKTT